MPLSPPEDRRHEPRRPTHARGVILASGFEMGCVIVDASSTGMKLRLDRQMTLPSPVIVVDVVAGTACEADMAWTRGAETGLKCRNQTSLRGLVPARLAAARDAWRRAGGR